LTLRPQVVRERLRKLREILSNLEKVKGVPRREFVRSFQHYWLGERGLHLAAEAVFDIGNHVLAGRFNVHPNDYEDVLDRLTAHEVISAELRDRMRGLGGFRNVLVHAYLEIDEGRVYDSLHDEADAFDQFSREIESFLESVDAS